LPVATLTTVAGVRQAEEARPGEYLVQGEIGPATVAGLTAWLAERGVLLADLRVGRQTLEEVFLRLTSDEGRGDGAPSASKGARTRA
jgi:ABC-2 type transport system ATP-binding protein